MHIKASNTFQTISVELSASESKKDPKPKGSRPQVEMLIVMDGCEEMKGLELTIDTKAPTWEEVEVRKHLMEDGGTRAKMCQL